MLDCASPRHWGTTYEQRFSVVYDYPVIFTRDLFDPENPVLIDTLCRREPDKRHRLAVFVDDNLDRVFPELRRDVQRYALAHQPRMTIVGDLVSVPGGEAAKNEAGLIERLLGELLERNIDRHSFTLALGGGAVLDAVGYAAAIFHRGVRHVRVPTTVLAQDDSGVGVKNAVNALGLKNLVGTFAPPFAVLNDGAFIDRLPAREKRGGLSEAVKVALIRDGVFFHWIEENAQAIARFEPNCLDRVIERSAQLHMHQIANGGDPFEAGSARPLDYGHWVAHKLETMTGHAVSHGEAVAVGIALDARYSVLAGLLPSGEEERIAALLETLGFTLWRDELATRGPGGELAVMKGLRDFQEHLGGELTVTLLAAIGQGVEVHEIDTRAVEQSVAWLATRSHRARERWSHAS